jgi:hypothetical protein
MADRHGTPAVEDMVIILNNRGVIPTFSSRNWAGRLPVVLRTITALMELHALLTVAVTGRSYGLVKKTQTRRTTTSTSSMSAKDGLPV